MIQEFERLDEFSLYPVSPRKPAPGCWVKGVGFLGEGRLRGPGSRGS